MLNKLRKTAPIATLAAAAALIAATSTPSFAYTEGYCRNMARESAPGDTGNALMMIVPLAAVGAGAGALVGVVAGGVAVTTGASVGAVGGAGLGLMGAGMDRQHDYDQAYEDCLRGTK